jgi:hypothetical protein
MDDCLNAENITLRKTPSSILFNGGNIIPQQGYGNNNGKHKICDNNHSLPNPSPPPATTLGNKYQTGRNHYRAKVHNILLESMTSPFVALMQQKARQTVEDTCRFPSAKQSVIFIARVF